ncbi:MAG: hypothetical protein HY698_03630 [Deltaproteobacteria bacterium]|nr:hypothetical protein [Deltaproteobacteria bacterium]
MRSMFTILPLLLALSSQAEARKPEDVYGGRILHSEKAYPTTSKSPAAFTAAIKKQSTDRFVEDKEKKQWKVHYAAFFRKPLNDLEVTVKLFDVTGGAMRMVESFQQYLDARGQRVILGNLKLKKGDGGYEPNTKILMVMEADGKAVAQGGFYILGEGRKYSGKVEFSEEETTKKEE